MVGDSMEKIKNLNRYQKGIVILLVVMAILFAALYSMATSKVGFLYKDKILEVSEKNGNTFYFGKSRVRNADLRFVPERK